jgi:hypothetical protein
LDDPCRLNKTENGTWKAHTKLRLDAVVSAPVLHFSMSSCRYGHCTALMSCYIAAVLCDDATDRFIICMNRTLTAMRASRIPNRDRFFQSNAAVDRLPERTIS